MSKAKFQAAKELIGQKKYTEARAILKTIDHPKAKEWLVRLDKLSAAKPAVNTTLFVIIVGFVIVLGIGVLFARQILNRSNQDSAAGILFNPQCDEDAWWDEVEPLVERFLDIAETAAQTSRMSLSSVIIDLQDARRTFEAADYQDCTSEVRNEIASGMSYTVDGFNSFLGRDDIGSSVELDFATVRFATAYELLFAIHVFPDIRMSNTAAFIWGGLSPDDFRLTLTASP